MHPRSSHRLIGHLILPALLSFGTTWVATTAPAIACGNGDYGSLQSAKTPPFGFQNGLRLGSREDEVIKILGRPQERLGAGVRCASNRDRLRYESTTVVLDTPALPGADHPSIRNRVIVRFTTQNPQFPFANGLHVGDHRDKLLETYGQPDFERQGDDWTELGYSQGNESLWIKLKDDRIDTFDLRLNQPDRPSRRRTAQQSS
jgi:hypothetical protein